MKTTDNFCCSLQSKFGDKDKELHMVGSRYIRFGGTSRTIKQLPRLAHLMS